MRKRQESEKKNIIEIHLKFKTVLHVIYTFSGFKGWEWDKNSNLLKHVNWGSEWCIVNLLLTASRPPMTRAVTALPTFTEDVGKDPWHTSAASITSDTCTLPMLPSSSVIWMLTGFTVRTFPSKVSPKQWPLESCWLSEVVRCRLGARCQDTRGSPCSSWQLGSVTSTAKLIPAFSVSDSERRTSFMWLLVWITVSFAVSSNETTAKSLSMYCTVALCFDPSINCRNTNRNTNIQKIKEDYSQIIRRSGIRQVGGGCHFSSG